MKRIGFIFFVILFGIVIFPNLGLAALEESFGGEVSFHARVEKIIETEEMVRDDGVIIIKQKLSLRGLDDPYENQEIIYNGLDMELMSSSEYHVGDRVVVVTSPGLASEPIYYITGYVRTRALLALTIIFVLSVLVIARFKGFRALLVLVLTAVVILMFVAPKILSGGNPLVIGIVGSTLILVATIYITEGFKRTSTIAVVAIWLSLLVTGFMAAGFTALSKLTGFATEEAVYLLQFGDGQLDMRGILLVGIILGTLGVLDDVVISQVMIIKELKRSNPELTFSELFFRGMNVGVSHLSSMVNTLFLAYAGAALPLLILFSVKQEPFLSVSQVINNEVIATEIVRTLVGSLGLILAVPLATFLAAKFIKKSVSREV